MKRTLALAALMLSLVCHADDTYYGAWNCTWTVETIAGKPAGAVEIKTIDSDSPVFWEHVATITVHLSPTENITVTGYWKDISPKIRQVIVDDDSPENIGYTGPRYVLNIKRISGAVTGNFSSPQIRGKIQATRQ